jgi:hypothetical protein
MTAELPTAEQARYLTLNEEHQRSSTGTQLVERAGELSPAQLPQLAAQLADAVAKMNPDDVIVEVDAKRDGNHTAMNFKFRAYRRAK